MIKRGAYLLLVLFLSLNFSVTASHIRAGEISVKQKNCAEGIFLITLAMYGNSSSPVSPGEGILNFGDGSFISSPRGSFLPRPDLGAGIGVYSFTSEHKYNQIGSYTVSYSETSRNSGILNIQNSVQTPFFIETKIIFNSSICNNSPILLAPPVDRACSKLSFFHNPAAFDEDGDSLSFEIAVPLLSSIQQATYLAPNHSSFYASDFNTGNEAGNGQPQFLIDAFGTITWDAPSALGEYNIAFIVNEWRKMNDVYVKLGSVRRDMQILVEECSNRRPDLIIPQDICVYAGTVISEIILGSDPDNNDVKIEVLSGIFSLPNNPAVFLPNPSEFQPSAPNASLAFLWMPNCYQVRNQPYQITIKITDNPLTGPNLVRFKTWNIKIAAPPPILVNAELDVINRKSKLSWSSYSCTNASKILIWRRVGSFSYNPDDCVSGLPKFAGYKKITEVSPEVNEFIDDNGGAGLSVGAVYCYRITVLFPLVGGAESRVSSEFCIPPILADAPIITHISVSKTDEQDGEMIISWRSPYDLSQLDYLQPYEYQIFRATGLTGNNEIIKIHSSNILDTTFRDSGLNTKDFGYNYRILLLAKNVNDPTLLPLDTSSIASSVWNEATPRENSIELNWNTETPWSNVIQDNPWHLIYRYDEGSGSKESILIDSVNVSENGFYFLDEGTYQDKKLTSSKFYCYRILTRGTYGNPAIETPLENFSQVFCSTIFDNIPPCKPQIVKSSIDCNLFNTQTPCSQQVFSNSIEWLPPADDDCMKDIYSYQLFAANSLNEEFQLIGVTDGNEFLENHLTKLSRCYKVASVDRSGNISEFSEEVCYDNCPSIFIPNVFTPNGDQYNEKFSLYNSNQDCSRFVDQVSFSVFNRWGQNVIDRLNEGSVLWDGKDTAGKSVPEGVYFYQANVLFDVLDSAKRNKQIRGWIHVVR